MKAIIQLLVVLSVITLCFADSPFESARKFRCNADEKIEVNNMMSQCKCGDGSVCIWTEAQGAVHGCPCPSAPAKADYTCLKTAEYLKCSNKQIECTKNFGQCECATGGLCAWAGSNAIAGCPCPGGRMPTASELNGSPKQPNKTGQKKRQEPDESL